MNTALDTTTIPAREPAMPTAHEGPDAADTAVLLLLDDAGLDPTLVERCPQPTCEICSPIGLATAA